MTDENLRYASEQAVVVVTLGAAFLVAFTAALLTEFYDPRRICGMTN